MGEHSMTNDADDPTVAKTDAPILRVTRKSGRRVVTAPPHGSDPTPTIDDRDAEVSTVNDERLKRDKPPHWG